MKRKEGKSVYSLPKWEDWGRRMGRNGTEEDRRLEEEEKIDLEEDRRKGRRGGREYRRV